MGLLYTLEPMDTPMNATQRQPIQLTEDDLLQNEHGQLSARQQQVLRTHRYFWYGVLGLVSLFAITGLGILIVALTYGIVRSLWLLFAVAGSGAVLLVVIRDAWQHCARLTQVLERREVAVVEGAIRYTMAYGIGLIRWARYAIQIADIRFRVSQAIMFQFTNQAAYRVYYVPQTRLFLGAVALATDPGLNTGSPPQVLTAHSQDTASPQAVQHEHLTRREVQIVRLIADGRSNQEIADSLHLSVNTIKMYTSQVYAKLGVRNRTEAVAYARRHKIIEAD